MLPEIFLVAKRGVYRRPEFGARQSSQFRTFCASSSGGSSRLKVKWEVGNVEPRTEEMIGSRITKLVVLKLHVRRHFFIRSLKTAFAGRGGARL